MTPGEVAYAQNCFKCHGDVGAGTELAPEIRHPIRDRAMWVVRNGFPGEGFLEPMPARTTTELPDADLNLILDLLGTPPQPTTGEGLFLDYCANCHGKDARGGVTERDLQGETDNIPMQVREGAHPGEFGNRGEHMSVFTTSILSDAEVGLIQDHVESLVGQ